MVENGSRERRRLSSGPLAEGTAPFSSSIASSSSSCRARHAYPSRPAAAAVAAVALSVTWEKRCDDRGGLLPGSVEAQYGDDGPHERDGLDDHPFDVRVGARLALPRLPSSPTRTD